jgi:hypothetical protein
VGVGVWILPYPLILNASRFDRLGHYKRFQKAKQAKQKEVAITVKRAVSFKSKDEKTKSQRGEPQTNSDSRRYDKKLAQEKERDAAWSNDQQWRREILRGRSKKKPEAVSTEREGIKTGEHEEEVGEPAAEEAEGIGEAK